jgi:hypothetical protein
VSNIDFTMGLLRETGNGGNRRRRLADFATGYMTKGRGLEVSGIRSHTGGIEE